MFISSACGDSILVSFDLPEPLGQSATTAPRSIKGKGRAHESTDGGAWTIILDDEVQAEQTVKERWMNLAPMKDMAVVEEEDGRVVSFHLVSQLISVPPCRGLRFGKHQLSPYRAQRRRARERRDCRGCGWD